MFYEVYKDNNYLGEVYGGSYHHARTKAIKLYGKDIIIKEK